MKRFLLLGLIVVTAASSGGCRWWREGDVCNACSAPTAYPGEVYYGGQFDAGYYGEPMIEAGTPMMPVPESIPTPAR